MAIQLLIDVGFQIGHLCLEVLCDGRQLRRGERAVSEAGQVDGHPVHERPPLLEQGLEARVVEFDHSLDNRRTRELTGQDLAPQFAPAGHDLGAIIRRHFAEHFAGARNLALLAVRVGRRDQTVALQRIDRALHLVEFLFNVGRCCCACRIRCGAGFNFIVGKGTRRSAEDRLADIGKLLKGLSSRPPASHAASVRETLTEDHHRLRNLLTPLRALEFASHGNDPAMRQLDLVGGLHDRGMTELPPDCNVPVSASWRDLVDGEDRQRALRALEASAVMSLRKGLRRGTVWINHSLSFRERDQLLIPPAQWEVDRDRHLSSLGLPSQARLYLDRLTEHLKAGLAALDEAREAGHFTIDADGILHLSPLEAQTTDTTPQRTRDLLFKDIGSAQFADMILEMDARTNFSEVLLARKARDAHELVSLYAALIAHGTELDAKGVAAMIPQLDLAHVSTAMRSLEMPGRLRRANERVVEFQRTHPITDLWGTGQLASSDSMSLDTSPHLFYARADPRRRTHAAGVYTHVLDQHGIVYNQPMVLNERQTGAAIEGVMRHNETRADGGLLRLAVDTHGYTNVGMAVAKLLGFDLCPWLRNLSERKLYLPRALSVTEGLSAAVSHEVSLKAIRDGWDGLLRLVASIHAGRVSAIVALQRFGSAAQGDPIHRAADHLGKLLRTLFLCDFFSNIEFRRELRTLLNRGESVHHLQRAIYMSKVQHERGRRQDEMIAISGALSLLTNLVIAWNTERMQTTVDTWQRKGQRIDDDWLRRMGPAHFAHVNFRGVLSFKIHQFQDALLEAAPRRRASQA
nr:Tn3 family transposase [Ralstonia mannitolilytica]